MIIKKIIKYSIGGGIAAIVDLSILYILTSFFGIYYLVSASISFIISFFIGFYFQKYITFQNYDNKHILQGSLFLLFQSIGIGINLILLYIGVEILGIYYMYIAICNKIIIFAWNFTMNNLFNFKNNNDEKAKYSNSSL